MRFKNKGKTCSVGGCDNPAKSRGMCGKHYNRMDRHGDVNTVIQIKQYPEGFVCLTEGCENSPFSRGYCTKHYQTLRNNGEVITNENICYSEECDRQAVRLGLCSLHYARWQRNDGNIGQEPIPGLIYAIGEEGGYVKIGHTKTLESLNKRLKNLQIGNPRTLYVISTSNVDDRVIEEKMIHDSLKESGLYLRGEWFAITHEEAKEILRRIEK